jgi:hypothetical protein
MRLLGSSAAKRPASGPHTIRSAVAAASRKPSRSGSSPRSAKKAGKNGEENPNALNRLAALIANILNPPAGNVLPMRRLSRHTGGVLRYGVEGRPGHQQFRQSGSGHVHAELFREGQKTLRPSPDPGLIWDLFGDLAMQRLGRVLHCVPVRFTQALELVGRQYLIDNLNQLGVLLLDRLLVVIIDDGLVRRPKTVGDVAHDVTNGSFFKRNTPTIPCRKSSTACPMISRSLVATRLDRRSYRDWSR